MLSKFVLAFPDRYEVRSDNGAYFYRCREVLNLQQIHNVLLEAAQLHGDAWGFTTLTWAGEALRKKNIDIKNSEYGTLKNLMATFPDRYEIRGEGSEVSYRCRGVFDLQAVHDTLHEAAKLHGDANGFATLTWAGEALRKKNIDIKNSEYGTLRKFVCTFPDRYEIRGEGAFVAYRCRVADKLQPIHDALREVAKLHGDEKGFVHLSYVGDALSKKNLSLKGSGHATVSKFLAAFPKLYEVKDSGGGNYYRLRD